MNNDIKKQAIFTICGGAGKVTGANLLCEISGKKILFDVGLVQEGRDPRGNLEDFPYDPNEIDAVFISHAHIDHIGRLPRLVSQGFNGPIYSTSATKDLALPMLLDAMKVFRIHAKEFDIQEDLYNENDIKKTLSLWKTVSYHKEFTYLTDVSITPYYACHILGACMYKISSYGTNIVYTGDMGNSPHALLKSIDTIPDVHYLFMECVYGDRNHAHTIPKREALEHIIENVSKTNGTLLIPTFSLERTQEILFELNELYRNNQTPKMPVYLDTPLGEKITVIYKKHIEDLNDKAKEILRADPDIFSFSELHIITKDSKDVQEKIARESKIVLAGSGMSEGGRILSYYKDYIENTNTTIAFVGYQSPGTLGRRILEGQKNIHLKKETLKPKCHIENISGFSGHRGMNELLEFVESHASHLKFVFCILGEPNSTMSMAQKISDNFGIPAKSPNDTEKIIIPLG